MLEVEQLESDTIKADHASQSVAVEETVIKENNESAVSCDVSQSQTEPPMLHDQAQNVSSVSTGTVNTYLAI